MKLLLLIVAAFAFHTALTLGNPIETKDDNFNAFLINALEKYPDWLRDLSFDPSPPSQTPFTLRINKDDLKLNVTITGEQIAGQAHQNSSLEITQVISSTAINWIILGFETRGVVSFQGNYNASGTIDSDVALNGTGSWKYTSNVGIHENVNAIFDINDNGYISISDYYYLHNVYPLEENNDEIYFEGLWDDVAAGNAEVIKESLRAAYLNRLADSETKIPNRALLFQYLQKIFRETPLDEMIGWSGI